MDAPFPARAEMTGILDISHPNPYKRPSENQTSVKQGFAQDFQTASIQAAKPRFEIGLTNAAYSNNSPSPRQHPAPCFSSASNHTGLHFTSLITICFI
ncbi:hypothetical protein [uncultured Neisseria sp.]|uniref:hypothetical protein n=1 Tax=uncultured Neisseria sp. TaxID=237778 RepID=UPI002625600B|nr:hypothetical protein [uncultured Neisseria sp.]